MRTRTFGRTGWKVSEVGLGAWGIGGNAHGNSYGPTDDATSLEALRAALEAGCTFVDTADVYGHGHSEELVGRALAEWGDRESVVVATKVGGDFYHGAPRLNFAPDYLDFALERSLERLGTDHVDLWQLHNPPGEVVHDAAVWEKLEALKAEGRIRAYGISIHDPEEGIHAMEHAPGLASVQVVYNLLARAPEEELFQACAERGVAVIAREPLANGFLAGKYRKDSTFAPGDIRYAWPPAYRAKKAGWADRLRFLERPGRTLAQAALQFCLARPEVSVVIPGAKTPAQARENLAASELGPLTRDEIARTGEVLLASR